MRINKIELCNFGSYEGICVFDLATGNKGNIVLIGGKNGAGKTTLFSGIKLCLYGNKFAGFENVNSFYRKEVKKYINDISKFDIFSKCYVKLFVSFSNGQKDDDYELMRQWDNNAKLLEDFESFTVRKNGVALTEEERYDFDNYIMNIIPPELFDLFFFDGEQIADYFLGENGNLRVKNAFMVLCGYDTFDIMQKNFKRLAFGKKSLSKDGISYIEAKQQAEKKRKEWEQQSQIVSQTKEEIDTISGEIKALEKKYKLSGGVSYEEWNHKLYQLKEEERFREEKNSVLKKMANDSIPFIIVKKLLEKLLIQVEKEHEKQQFELLKESLENLLPNVVARVSEKLELDGNNKFTDFVIEELGIELKQKNIMDVEPVVNISGEEYHMIHSKIVKYLNLDKAIIIKTEQAVRKSVEKTQALRKELEECNIDGIQDFLNCKNHMVEQVNKLSAKLQEYMELLLVKKVEYDEAVSALKREEKRFEELSKNLSILELSEKSVAFLDVLQRRLYKNEIVKVEGLFMKKIKELARKKQFIDKIIIDADFNVHIYKKVSFNTKRICSKIKKMGIQPYISEYGNEHCQTLFSSAEVGNLNEFLQVYGEKSEIIEGLQEIEKSRLSKGEKQIFIMALYWSLIQLNKQQVPFVIDTPFARIDTEHRLNIAKKFFMDLSGQVFIFSTNEEIVGENYERMKNRVQAKFLLENTDNLRTTIYANEYFGG